MPYEHNYNPTRQSDFSMDVQDTDYTPYHITPDREGQRTMKWWEYEQEEVNQGRRRQPMSERWGGQGFGLNTSWWKESGVASGQALETRRLEKAGALVVRLSNTVLNAQDGGSEKKENHLKFNWAKPGVEINTGPHTKYIVCDPKWILDGKVADDAAASDAVGGLVLMQSTLKRTMSKAQFFKAKKADEVEAEAEAKNIAALPPTHPLRVNQERMKRNLEETKCYVEALVEYSKRPGAAGSVRKGLPPAEPVMEVMEVIPPGSNPLPVPLSKFSIPLWESVEITAAREDLLETWPGFAGYMIAYSDKTSASKKEVQEFIDKCLEDTSKTGSLYSAAMAAARWSVANPHNPVTISDSDVQREAAIIAKAMRKSIATPNERFDVAQQEADRLATVFSRPEGDGDTGPSDKGGVGLDAIKTDKDHKLEQSDINGKDPETRPDIPDGVGSSPKCRVIKVKESSACPASYSKQANIVRQLTEAVKKALRFRMDSAETDLVGLKSGELDEVALSDLVMREAQPRIFLRKEVETRPDVAIYILLDQSGSMGSCGYNATGPTQPRVVSARQVCIALYEAIKDIKGISIGIFGHTSHSGDDCAIYEYISKAHPGQHRSVAEAEAHSSNLDGFAIEYVVKRIADENPETKQKFVFVLSDGQPAGDGYGGASAFKHMLNVCEWAKKTKGVRVYGLGMDGSPSDADGKKMYGEGKFACLPNVTGAVPVISSFLSRTLGSI